MRSIGAGRSVSDQLRYDVRVRGSVSVSPVLAVADQYEGVHWEVSSHDVPDGRVVVGLGDQHVRLVPWELDAAGCGDTEVEGSVEEEHPVGRRVIQELVEAPDQLVPCAWTPKLLGWIARQLKARHVGEASAARSSDANSSAAAR